MADNENLPYIPNAEEVQEAIEYSKLEPIHPIDGIIINKGTMTLNIDFDNFDTHVDMCYEFSDCQLLEPEGTDDLWGILICHDIEGA